jgi:hypothetical protein
MMEGRAWTERVTVRRQLTRLSMGSLCALAVIGAGGFAAPALAAPPANDNFADAQDLGAVRLPIRAGGRAKEKSAFRGGFAGRPALSDGDGFRP